MIVDMEVLLLRHARSRYVEVAEIRMDDGSIVGQCERVDGGNLEREGACTAVENAAPLVPMKHIAGEQGSSAAAVETH